jgi:AmmeMemoRadiSam system protein B
MIDFNKKTICLIIAALIIPAVFLLPGIFHGFYSLEKAMENAPALEVPINKTSNRTLFYDKQHFMNTLPSYLAYDYTDNNTSTEKTNSSENLSIEAYSNVKGIVCTHHILASKLIHNLFLSVKDNDYEHIIILGPDHTSRQGLKILTSDRDWQTPFGILKASEYYINILLEHPYVKIDNEAMELEHSSAALVPYVKYYFPNTQIATLAVSAALDMKEAKELGDFLTKTINQENTLLIASIDFSHYLSVGEAYKKDEETLSVIEERDFEKIYRFNNDNLDSPQSLIAFLTYIDSIGCSNMVMLEHSNSYDIVPADPNDTTSYFTFVCN